INLVATRKLPSVAGGAGAPTRSIAAATAYVARSLGYGDDQLNINELERLDGIWQARGDTFDFVISDGTALDAMKMMLRAGFADVTLDNGIITPVRDEPRTQLEDGYSPENMTAPLQRQFTGKQPDEADGVEVEYTNADTWTTETVMCTLPGDQQIKVDKIKLDGVTDRTRAWRIGMRRRRAQRYRRWTYSFNTELDALNSQYLSYVPLLDDIPGYGKVAILTGIQADRITVSEPLEWEDGKTHVVAYRDENGDTVGPFPATQGQDAYTVMVSIPQPWPAVLPSDREQTHIYFGTTDRWSFPALITEISPNGPLQVGVTATNYDERVYANDNSTP
ncbi:MAG: host specificity factor TipJ family phage tail protein, partial [Candidatus Methanomethylicaceae archaeon]